MDVCRRRSENGFGGEGSATRRDISNSNASSEIHMNSHIRSNGRGTINSSGSGGIAQNFSDVIEINGEQSEDVI